MNRFIRLSIFFSFAIGMVIYASSCTLSGTGKVALDIAAKPFEQLSQYNFFKGTLNQLLPNDRIMPYDLISPLFSDYAHKARFIYLPEGKTIDYVEDKVLQLPVGACIIKNFYYPADFRKPEGERRIIETRLLVHRADAWDAVEYIWNDEQTDAHLEVAGDLKRVSWIHFDGTKKDIDYIIPSKNQWRHHTYRPQGEKYEQRICLCRWQREPTHQTR
jgi:hypothetical protein